MTESALAPLRAALSGTRVLLAGVRAEQWDVPTPCPEWTVADLVAHIVQGNRMFATRLRGDAPPEVSDDPAAGLEGIAGGRLEAYDTAAEQLLEAFEIEGVLDRMVTVPFGTVPGGVALHLRITELLVHGWDLARATGQQLDVPDAVAEHELAFSQTALKQLPAERSPFGPAQRAPADANPLDQLAALLGRPVYR